MNDDSDRKLDCTIVVRVHPATLMALRADAEANGRTVAQSVRFLLKKALES